MRFRQVCNRVAWLYQNISKSWTA